MQTQVISTFVQITPIDAAPAHGPWQVDHGGHGNNVKSKFPVVDLPPHTGPYLITFQIAGSNAVKFSDDPIWVKAGGDPKPSDNHKHNQIQAPKVSPDGKQLTVFDPNTDKATLHYRLNFTGDSNHQSLDPIIKNGGGTGPHAFTTIEILIAGALLLA